QLTIPATPDDLEIFAIGGSGMVRAEWLDGEKTGKNLQRNGADLRRVTGLAVSLRGQGLDGATVETTTALEEVPSGTIFKGQGEVEVRVRADAQAGFGNGAPRGDLNVTVFVERLEPVGKVSDLLASQGKSGDTSTS